MKSLLGIIWLTATYAALNLGCSDYSDWTTLDQGLEYIRFEAPDSSKLSGSKIDVIRADPSIYELRLLCATEFDCPTKTVKQWCKEFKMHVAINGGMYQKDLRTSVAYLKANGHINNAGFHQRYQSALAFDALSDSLKKIQIADLEYQPFAEIRDSYNSVLQGLRMINKYQENMWELQPEKIYAIAAVGIDKGGDVLFLFSQDRHTAHDFINTVKMLPLELLNMMYLEGGPIAQLFINTPRLKKELQGKQLFPQPAIPQINPVPNVLGIVKKSR